MSIALYNHSAVISFCPERPNLEAHQTEDWRRTIPHEHRSQGVTPLVEDFIYTKHFHLSRIRRLLNFLLISPLRQTGVVSNAKQSAVIPKAEEGMYVILERCARKRLLG